MKPYDVSIIALSWYGEKQFFFFLQFFILAGWRWHTRKGRFMAINIKIFKSIYNSGINLR